jgi:hypothetical protein
MSQPPYADLVPASPEDLADALSFGLRYDPSGRATNQHVAWMADLASGLLVERLLADGYVLMRRPPRVGPSVRYDMAGRLQD